MNENDFALNPTKENLKVGVFLCRCGGNISDNVDMEKLRSSLDATVVEEFENLCSINGRKLIRDSIIDKDLDRVVVAACSPITHEKTFQNYVKPLNPYLMQMANIREQCSWVHSDTQKTTDKAISLTAAAVEKAKYSEPITPLLRRTKKSAAVIGGGISGITTALSLARQGIKTRIIEEKSTIGGSMVKIGKVFSPEKLAEECAMCLLNPLVNEAVENKNIKILTKTKLLRAERRAGNFNLIVEKRPGFVKEERCIACGSCAEVCPVEVPNSWNEGMTIRKAIYKSFPQAVPDVYTIDDENCIQCGACQETCNMDAIDFSMETEVLPINVGSVIIATGHKGFDLSKRPEYGYGRFPDVVSQMELARIMGVNGPTEGQLQRPSNGAIPKRVVMIQCTGSRDEKPDGNPYCSKVCCMVAMKHSNVIKHYYPETEVIICYTDMRTPGMYEKYLRYGQTKGIKLIRGRAGEVTWKNGNLVVRVEESLEHSPLEIETDMVVLSEAMEPSEGTQQVAQLLDVGLTEDMFIRESHPKIKPVNTDVEGIYVCGTAQGPKDITDSVSQANAAAAKVAELMNGNLEVEPFVATIDTNQCDLCKKCMDTCKYKAIYVQEDNLAIDPIACKGCGICLSQCPEEAISIMGNADEKLFAIISGVLKTKEKGERIILTFLDSVGYLAADNMGINKISYPESIRIIKIPSSNRLMAKHILYAFEKGADGIFLGEYPDDLMYPQIKEKVKNLKEVLGENNINPNRLTLHRVYIPYFRGLANKLTLFDQEIISLNQEHQRVDGSAKVLDEPLE
ncbi:ferredoxin:CoB-CoM heterodisulfide reductase subunit HdrA [Methanobacterium sp.]|uniref:ferredoxin:CoB-CoM heterodisulfide reductase subunit HdrA n=1 Tax=Methanobacterium sp. TaxID=2164 RepID=UPI002AB84515|nr:ferredoxin:CoB-CoM heterodisulfide reductase subunit HdrA [Methanobacterium sp.]MDY9922388.1 ferredoxin:CoB-CoM heterodisulfide reductase subunit HdrA [Methanobacterium sp.]